jgi:hypothetical protein
MREKMKRDKAAKEQQKLAAAAAQGGDDANKQAEQDKKKAEAQQQEERKVQAGSPQEKPQETLQDKEDGLGEKYSDIDEMYEKRLKNKEEEAKGTGDESSKTFLK